MRKRSQRLKQLLQPTAAALSPAVIYDAGASTGVTVYRAAVRTVVVSNEALSETIVMPGEVLTYTATVLDDTGATLPSAFTARLMLNGTELLSFTFTSDVYDAATGALALNFTFPDVPEGTYTVRLEWDRQRFA